MLYPAKQLEILDAYGKDEIHPAREKVREKYERYRGIQKELRSMDMDEEQRNRNSLCWNFSWTRSRKPV